MKDTAVQSVQLEFCYEAPGSLSQEAARRERRRESLRRWKKSGRGMEWQKNYRALERVKAARAERARTDPKTIANRRKQQATARAKIYRIIKNGKRRAIRCILGELKHVKGGRSKAEYYRWRVRTNPQYAMDRRLRSRMHDALKYSRATKSGSTYALLGCTGEELVRWIESKFLPGMTWENRSLWHIDHATPCYAFDLRNPEEQKRCFHYSNLRPLWKAQNIQKKHRMNKPRQLPLL